jgi:hypothetical protein
MTECHSYLVVISENQSHTCITYFYEVFGLMCYNQLIV